MSNDSDRKRDGLLGQARQFAKRTLAKAAETLTKAAGVPLDQFAFAGSGSDSRRPPVGRTATSGETRTTAATTSKDQPARASDTGALPRSSQEKAKMAAGSSLRSPAGARTAPDPATVAGEQTTSTGDKPPATSAAAAATAAATVPPPSRAVTPPPPPLQSFQPPPPPNEPQNEPFGLLDLEEPPEIYGVDEVTIIPRDPYYLFAYWEITAKGRAAARAALGSDGTLVLRLYSAAVKQQEQHADTLVYDIPVDWEHGRRYFPAPRPGAYVTLAVGLLAPDGRFAPIAHSPQARVPTLEPGPDGPIEWMEVKPVLHRGTRLEPPRVAVEGPAVDVPGAPMLPPKALVPRWFEGIWQHLAGSQVPIRAGEMGEIGPEARIQMPSWEEMPSSPWLWWPGLASGGMAVASGGLGLGTALQ
ncbi:MAG: DUF4912 domain-containing protein [Pseudomonadota bacterium]